MRLAVFLIIESCNSMRKRCFLGDLLSPNLLEDMRDVLYLVFADFCVFGELNCVITGY